MIPAFRLASVLVLASALAAPSSAQCPLPDNLDAGPCCGLVPAALPPFPQTAIPGLGVCYDQCAPNTQLNIRIDWAPLSALSCAQFMTQVKVTDSGTALPLMAGTMLLDYTRTWNEVDAAGQLVQVWRFVAKADLSSTLPAGVVAPCIVPSCLPPNGPHPTGFFYGYVDYARICGAAGFQQTAVLYHACDFLIHTPGLSDRPGQFHPGRSFALVAPHTTAQPFIPGLNPAPGGPLVAEAVREVNPSTAAGFCRVEDKVSGGILAPGGAGCFCPLSTLPAQHTISLFQGKASCPSPTGVVTNWSSLNVNFPLIPWPHLVSSSLGNWANPNLWPGAERVWANEGLFRYQDSCNGAAFYEVFYGATTQGGFPVVPGPSPGPPLTQTFVDMVDNFSAPLNGPYVLPLFGSIQKSNHLIYVNVP